MRKFDLVEILCDIWNAQKDDPGRSFTINPEHWKKWDIDEQTCKEAIQILIRRRFLEPVGPGGSNVPFPRLVTLTEKGFAFCEQHCRS